MVKQAIVLGHIISSKAIEVDKANVDLISNLPLRKTFREVRSFLEHGDFYRRFIKDFSKVLKLGEVSSYGKIRYCSRSHYFEQRY